MRSKRRYDDDEYKNLSLFVDIEESYEDERSLRRNNRSENQAKVAVKTGRKRIIEISESSGGEEDREEDGCNNSAFGKTKHPVKSQCLQLKTTKGTVPVKSNHTSENHNNSHQNHRLNAALPSLQEQHGAHKSHETVAAKELFSSSSNHGPSNHRSLSSVRSSSVTAVVNTSINPAIRNQTSVPFSETLNNKNFRTSQIVPATALTNQSSVPFSKSVSSKNFKESLAGLAAKDIPTFSLGVDDLMGDLDEEDEDFSESLLSKGPPPQWTALKSKALTMPSDNLLTTKNCDRTLETPLQHRHPTETSKQNSALPTTSAEKLRQERIRLSLQKKEEFQKKFKISPSATSE